MKHSTKLNKPNIGVITWAFDSIAGEAILTNFINILEPLSNELFVITGNFPKDTISNKKIHIINITHESKKEPTVIKVLRYISMQLRISVILIKISKNVDIVIFFFGMNLLLPMISTKLLKKKAISIATGSSQKSAEMTYSEMLFGYGRIILLPIVTILEKINYILSDVIVVYTENLIQYLELEKYRNKILVAPRHFVDSDKFRVKKKYNGRKNFVGYIGRLSEEKGVLNFVEAIPKVSKERSEIKFLIVGDGQIRDKIKRYLDEENLNEKVKLTGWIPHDELPKYLNELKLVVLPSYTEGLPSIMLEAIACGTPVLATPVGAVPDVIKDGKTGFIMENNSPECIAENVIRVLKHQGLDEIVKNAKRVIEDEFRYEAAVERYRVILNKIEKR